MPWSLVFSLFLPFVQTQRKRGSSKQCISYSLLVPCPPKTDLSSFVLSKHVTLSSLPISHLDEKGDAANKWTGPTHCGTIFRAIAGKAWYLLVVNRMVTSTGWVPEAAWELFLPLSSDRSCRRWWGLSFLMSETGTLLRILWGSGELNDVNCWAQS